MLIIKNREEDTPYISFHNSPEELEALANSRNRMDQNIVVIDPRTRIELGLPILHYDEAMRKYGIEPPYTRNYWSNHYLCLWEVTPAEVVGIWSWKELQSEGNWYKQIVMPAVERHRANRATKCLSLTESWNDALCKLRMYKTTRIRSFINVLEPPYFDVYDRLYYCTSYKLFCKVYKAWY